VKLFLSLMRTKMLTIRIALQTLLIPRVQQMIKSIPEPLGPRWDLLLMMVLRKLDLHSKDLCLPTPLALGGVVASPFLTPIMEDRPLAPRLDMVPGLMFLFWDLIPGLQKIQSPRDPQPSLILKRKWLSQQALVPRGVPLVPSRGGPTTLNIMRLNTAITSSPPIQNIDRDLPRELPIIDVDSLRTAELRLPTASTGPPTTGLHLLEATTNTDHPLAMSHMTG